MGNNNSDNSMVDREGMFVAEDKEGDRNAKEAGILTKGTKKMAHQYQQITTVHTHECTSMPQQQQIFCFYCGCYMRD